MLLLTLGCAGDLDPPAVSSPEQIAEVPRKLGADLAPASPGTWAASHILVAYDSGAQSPRNPRSRAQALELADRLHSELLAGADFADLARSWSDDPSRARGGRVGTFRTGTMVPTFEAAVAHTEIGELTAVIETGFGFHIVRRDPVMNTAARHILVTFTGAWRSSSNRSKADANARITTAQDEIAAGARFEEVARRFGEDLSASKGGDLGTFSKGQLIPALEQAILSLEPGEVSDVIETPYGFHLIQRLRQPSGL